MTLFDYLFIVILLCIGIKISLFYSNRDRDLMRTWKSQCNSDTRIIKLFNVSDITDFLERTNLFAQYELNYESPNTCLLIKYLEVDRSQIGMGAILTELILDIYSQMEYLKLKSTIEVENDN